jgi:molybdopterin synthase sulfur carrier subunit
MKIQVRYFASVREAIGLSSEQVETGAATLAILRLELIGRGGAYAEALAAGRALRTALNQTMADESTALTDGAEVAFFPPVTGG